MKRPMLLLSVSVSVSVSGCLRTVDPLPLDTEGTEHTGDAGDAGDAGRQTLTFTFSGAPPSYVMIVQDLSGAMCKPLTADAGTLAPTGVCAADPAASQIGLTATNVPQVLAELGSDRGDFGLTAFPGPADSGTVAFFEACAPPSAPTIPFAAGDAAISQIAAFYSGAAAQVGGGAPMAEALSVAGRSFPATAAKKVILLVTDGFPNCNSAHPCVVDNLPWSPDGIAHGCMSPNLANAETGLAANETPPAGCVCSFGSCSDLSVSSSDCCNADPALSVPGQINYTLASDQCLDDARTLSVVAGLAADAGIVTVPVGMGEANVDFALLDQIAQAGQGSPQARHLQTDDEPGLYDALLQLTGPLGDCAILLPTIADPGAIRATLDGAPLVDGTDFTYAQVDAGTGNLTLSRTQCALVNDGQPHTLVVSYPENS